MLMGYTEDEVRDMMLAIANAWVMLQEQEETVKHLGNAYQFFEGLMAENRL